MSKPNYNNGYTMIEIIIVVAIIGTLIAFLSGAILYSMKIASKKANSAQAETIENAIHNYFSLYTIWPIEKSDVGSGATYDDDGIKITYRENNYLVINRLNSKNTEDNPDGKMFLTGDVINVKDKSGDIITLRRAWNGATEPQFPVVAKREDNTYVSVSITIDTVYNTVKVKYD